MRGTRQLGAASNAALPGDASLAELGPEPAPLAPDDVVPRFRTDLRVERHRSRGLCEMFDPRSGKRFTLYEFELTVARMLDGRRRTREVVEQGTRLGIPVDVEGLYKFVRQLWHYGFLAVGPRDTDDAGATWADRERWDEGTRALFQTGMRLMRTGRPADAASYFEAVLDAHPAHPDATEMLALIARGRSLEARRIGVRRLAVAAAALTLVAAAAAGLLWARRVRPAARGAPSASVAQARPGIAIAVAAPAPPAPNPPPSATPTSRVAFRSAAVQARRHPALAEISAPATGTLRWRRAPGEQVAQGERIADVRVAGAAEPPSPELARRIAQLEALAAKDPIYRDFLAKARREQQRRSRRPERIVPVLAPAAGGIARRARDRGRVARSAVLGQILDGDAWELIASLDGDPPPADWQCEVRGDAAAERSPCRIVQAAALDGEPRRASFTAHLSVRESPWVEKATSLQIRVAPSGAALTMP